MSALDDLIARDSGASGDSAIDALITRDAGGGAPANPTQLSPARQPLTGFTAAAIPQIASNARDMLAGAVRGAGSIGATILAPWDMAKDAMGGKGISLDSNRQRRADMDAALTSLGADPSSVNFGAGKLAAEIAGTAGVGGALAAPVRAVSSAAPRLAPLLDPIASSIGSGGFSTGNQLPWWASIPVRAAGGAVNGAVAAGLVNPDDAKYGAMIGGAFPLGVWGAGKMGQAIANAYRSAGTSQETKVAQNMASQLGLTANDLRSAVTGPQMIPGYVPTVPQIVQDPVASQLQRTLQTAGQQAVADANSVQQAQFRDALNRIAPTAPTVNDAANRAGNAISGFAIPARKQAGEDVSALFNAIPSDTAMQLPLSRMQAAQTKYMGPGTFGDGVGQVEQAMNTATQIGTNPLSPLTAQAVPFQQIQSLRSSIGEAIGKAKASGNASAAAALTDMKAAIDNKVADVAMGNAQPGEVFTPQAVDAWGQGLAAHAGKKAQFDTGPQAAMFRMGGDGQPLVQGAEIPPKFYNGNGSQVEDVQAFKRLIGNDPAGLAQELKSYALTQGVSNETQNGNLAQNFIKWMQSRSGANRALFNQSELATINEVGSAVQRQIAAENLGRVTGPDTAQKLASLQSNGMLDSKGLDAFAHKVPIVKYASGPILDWLRTNANQARGGIQAGLLADPLRMADALGKSPGLLNFDPAPFGMLTRGAYPALLGQ